MTSRRKSVERHLDPGELRAAIDEAQRDGDARLVRRLCFVADLYEGDTLREAGRRVGVSQPTASRWADAWNDGGVEGLRPSFGGGRPPRLREDEHAAVRDLLEADPSVTARELQAFVESEFGVAYSRRHASRLLSRLAPD